jgi:cytochrome c
LTHVDTAIAFGRGSIDVRLRQEYLACGMSPSRKGKFMKTLHLLVVAGLLGMGFSAWANPQLADEKQCMQCHSVTKDGAGPAFQKIAIRWKGDQSAEKTLVATIRKGSVDGGGRHWGIAKMPDDSERPWVSEHEAKQLVKWILSL